MGGGGLSKIVIYTFSDVDEICFRPVPKSTECYRDVNLILYLCFSLIDFSCDGSYVKPPLDSDLS